MGEVVGCVRARGEAGVACVLVLRRTSRITPSAALAVVERGLGLR